MLDPQVPSWSKVAMRSSGGTKFGLDWSVVACTKSTIACFAGPSFHEGSRPACGLRWRGRRRQLDEPEAAAESSRAAAVDAERAIVSCSRRRVLAE